MKCIQLFLQARVNVPGLSAQIIQSDIDASSFSISAEIQVCVLVVIHLK